jgi:hypothetical protein
MGGRAVNIEEEYGSLLPAAKLADKKPCGRLLSTAHFHVDLYGYFIPPGCTGIRIPLAEAVRGIPQGKYRAFEALYEGGPARLFELALSLGFAENPRGYASRCGLCFHLRHFLCGHSFPELPREHYEESLKYY